jgi:hypothetical protein
MAHNKVLQTETRELASLSRGKIRPGDSDEWKNEQLYVPPLPPTNLRGCHLIKIQYDVYVSGGNLTHFSLTSLLRSGQLLLLSRDILIFNLFINREQLYALLWSSFDKGMHFIYKYAPKI